MEGVRLLTAADVGAPLFEAGTRVPSRQQTHTLEAAKAAYEAPEYQEMIRLRSPNSEACLSILEEGDKLAH